MRKELDEITVTLSGFNYIADGAFPDDFEGCLLVLDDDSLSAGCWDTGLWSTEGGKKPRVFRQSRGGVIDVDYVKAWVTLEDKFAK